MSFSFGGPPAAATAGAPAPSSGFSFGGAAAAPAAPAAAASSGFSFGGPSSSTTSGASPAPASASGFSFGGAPAAATATTAAAPSSISFGAPAAAGASDSTSTAATTTPSTTTTTIPPTSDAKPSAGGFSFGAPVTTAPATAPSTTTPSSSFSFGGAAAGAAASTPTTTTTTTLEAPGTPAPPTPGPPAPVATPGQQQQQQQPSTATTTSTPAPPTSLDYQSLTVEQILNLFQKTLETDSLTYVQQAKRVAEYDGLLRDAQRDISSLTLFASNCLQEQQSLQQSLIHIHTCQEELETTLDRVETQVDGLFVAQSHLSPVDADVERERSYSLAANVDTRLQQLQQTLQHSLERLELQQETVIPPPLQPVVKILNQHNSVLVELEQEARRLQHNMEQVQKNMMSMTTTMMK